jgi:hypothetical protein
MSRPVAAAFALALLLTFPASGHAQLGGLVKKARDKVVPATPSQPQSTDQPARLPGPEITSTVVEHLILGLKAEKEARDRAAAADEDRRRRESQQQVDPQSRYYSCIAEAQQNDPKMGDMQKLGKDAKDLSDKGEQSKAMDLVMQMQPLQLQIQARAESTCASQKPGAAAPTPTQQAIQSAPVVPPEEAGAKVAGLTRLDYAQVKELVYTYFGYGKRAGLTDSEKRAVDPKRSQLQDGFKLIGM